MLSGRGGIAGGGGRWGWVLVGNLRGNGVWEFSVRNFEKFAALVRMDFFFEKVCFRVRLHLLCRMN